MDDDQSSRPARRRVTPEMAVKAAQAAGLEPLEPYPGHAKSAWRCRALACRHEVITNYNKIQQRGLQCKECSRAMLGNSRRIPPEQASAVMTEAGLEPLAPYPGGHNPWPCRCVRCHHVVTPTYSSVRAGQGGCTYCGGNRVDPDEALALMREANLEPLVEYPGAAVPWKCVCLDCKRVVTPMYGSIRSGQRGCKFCSQVSVDPETAAQVMRDAGLEPLSPYPGQNKAPWRCRCLGCGAIVSPRYNTIQQGTALGCNRCGIERRGLVRRIPDDQAVAIMRAAGAEPLEPYAGSMRPWKCKCLTCGREISPNLHNVKASQNACGYCSGTKVDVQQAIQAMRETGVEPEEDFPGSDEPWSCQCLRCHRKVTPRYSSIKQGQTGCAYCAGRMVDPAEAVELMREAGVEPQGPWPGSDTDWPCICLTCNRTVSPRYNNVRRGYAPCGYCAGVVVDPVLAASLMKDKGYEPQVPYPGAGMTWECRHVPCGGIVYPRYSGIRAGYGGCTTCAKYGFTDSDPACIYLVHSAQHRAYKLGISNRGDNRLAEHRRFGWDLCTNGDMACLWHVAEGRVARKVEQAVRDWWRLDLVAPPAVGIDDMPQRGYTETISESFVSAEEIVVKVRDLIEKFRADS